MRKLVQIVAAAFRLPALFGVRREPSPTRERELRAAARRERQRRETQRQRPWIGRAQAAGSSAVGSALSALAIWYRTKKLSANNRCTWTVAWSDRVVPLAVEIGTGDGDGSHLFDSLISW